MNESPLDKVKHVQSIENELTFDTKEHIKIEDTLAVDVKVEESEMESLTLDVLTEELDIKPDIDVSSIENVDSELHSCAKQLLSENRHGVVHSTKANDGLFTCYICNFMAFSKKNLMNHIKIAGCRVKSHGKKMLIVHKITKHCVKQSQCIHCNAMFKSQLSLDDHVIKKHEEFITSVSSKIYQCKYCSYKSTVASNLTRHLTKHPESGYRVIPKKYPCIHCDVIFRRKQSLNDHVFKKHGEFIASRCSITTKRRHCIHCSKTFESKESLDDHVIKKHQEFTTTVSYKIHECKYCSYKTTKKFNLALHMSKHPEAIDSVKQWACIYCKATYKRRAGLDRHIIKKHTEDFSNHKTENPGSSVKPFLCIHCSETFTSKRTLYDHVIKKHEQFIPSVAYKIHQCQHCSYKTVRSTDLARHQKIRHETEYSVEQIECRYCSYKTTIPSHLARHLTKHAESSCSVQQNHCNHCDKMFSNKRSLDDHVIKKHVEFISSVTHKIHCCMHCNFKTTISSHLTSHMRKHPDT